MDWTTLALRSQAKTRKNIQARRTSLLDVQAAVADGRSIEERWWHREWWKPAFPPPHLVRTRVGLAGFTRRPRAAPCAVARGNRRVDANGNLLATTVTGSAGRYLFTNIAAGQYMVEFVLPGSGAEFTTKAQGGDPTLDSDADPATGRTDLFTLAAGQYRLDLDAGIRPIL